MYDIMLTSRLAKSKRIGGTIMLKDEVRRARRRAVLNETRAGQMLILGEENLLPILTRLFKAAAERQPYVRTVKVFIVTTREWFAVSTYPQTLEMHYTARDLGLERCAFGMDELWHQIYLDANRFELRAETNGENSYTFLLELE